MQCKTNAESLFVYLLLESIQLSWECYTSTEPLLHYMKVVTEIYNIVVGCPIKNSLFLTLAVYVYLDLR